MTIINQLLRFYTPFFVSNPILEVNVRVASQIYVFKAKICLGFALQFPKFLKTISNFSIVTSICPKSHCTQLSCVKVVSRVLEKFSFSELKIEKVVEFTQSSTKFF